MTTGVLLFWRLTVAGDIKAREFLEVGVLEALVVLINRSHQARPGLSENLQGTQPGEECLHQIRVNLMI